MRKSKKKKEKFDEPLLAGDELKYRFYLLFERLSQAENIIINNNQSYEKSK